MASFGFPPSQEKRTHHFGRLHSGRYVTFCYQRDLNVQFFWVGKIMRLTIPKSQGKQPYYDARKSSWGDIFPHPPKNAPQERNQPKKKSESAPSGDDIGKRKELHRRRERVSYSNLADGLKEMKKLSKKDYAKIRHDRIWYGMSDRLETSC
jgi:hypothetical protein